MRSAVISWKALKGIIVHSDRGGWRASAAVLNLLRQLGFRESFPGTGKHGDNAWSENCYSILKHEMGHPISRFGSQEK